MRKIIKPEYIMDDNKVVNIPDVEFEIVLPVTENFEEEQEDKDKDAEGSADAPKETIDTEELRAKIAAQVRDELAGEVARKKMKANSESDRIILDAKKQAESIIAAAENQGRQILSDAESQAAAMKQEAMEEGAKKGFEEKTKLLDNLALYISHSLEEIKKERNEFFQRYADELKHLAVDISEKVIARKIEEDDMIMYGVIKDAVRYVRDTKWVKAEVSAELAGYVDTLEQELKAAGQNVEFILTAGIPKDSCIVNTSDGLVVATLSEQIKNIREFIENLDKGDGDES